MVAPRERAAVGSWWCSVNSTFAYPWDFYIFFEPVERSLKIHHSEHFQLIWVIQPKLFNNLPTTCTNILLWIKATVLDPPAGQRHWPCVSVLLWFQIIGQCERSSGRYKNMHTQVQSGTQNWFKQSKHSCGCLSGYVTLRWMHSSTSTMSTFNLHSAIVSDMINRSPNVLECHSFNIRWKADKLCQHWASSLTELQTENQPQALLPYQFNMLFQQWHHLARGVSKMEKEKKCRHV